MNKLLVGLLAISIQFSAYAEPGKSESVKELLNLTNVDSMVDSMYAQMDQMLAGMGDQLGVTASEQDILDNYMKKITAAMREEMSWDKMEGPMIDIYLNNYTEEEIQDLLVFYRTDTGRALIKKMPAVLGESMLVSQELMQGFMPKLRELSGDLAEELKARRNTE